jgi:hypothetical protein
MLPQMTARSHPQRARPSATALPRHLHSGRSVRRWSSPRAHAHRAPELVLFKRGSYAVEVDGLMLSGPPGTVFVLPGGIPHTVHASGPWWTDYLRFEQPSAVIDEAPRTIGIRGDQRIVRWFADLYDLAQRLDPSA